MTQVEHRFTDGEFVDDTGAVVGHFSRVTDDQGYDLWRVEVHPPGLLDTIASSTITGNGGDDAALNDAAKWVAHVVDSFREAKKAEEQAWLRFRKFTGQADPAPGYVFATDGPLKTTRRYSITA